MTPPGYRPQRFGIVITGTSRSNPPGPSVAFSAKATGTPTTPDGRSHRLQRCSPLVPRVTHWSPCKLNIRWFSAESNVKSFLLPRHWASECFRGRRWDAELSPVSTATERLQSRGRQTRRSRALCSHTSARTLGVWLTRCALRLKVLMLNPSKLPSPGSATNPGSVHRSLARGLPHNSRSDSHQTTLNCQLHFGAHWTMSRSPNVATRNSAGTKGKVTHGPIR